MYMSDHCSEYGYSFTNSGIKGNKVHYHCKHSLYKKTPHCNNYKSSTNEATTSTNEAVASTNIPTTLTTEPKKRGRPKDTDEVKASKKAALDEAKATKKAAKEYQKNKV